MEGRSLQSRLHKFKSPGLNDDGKLARSFSKLMFQGKINTALQLLSDRGKGGVLSVDDTIDLGDNTKLKYPCAQPASPDAIPEGNTTPPVIHPVVFDDIIAISICRTALKTKGAAGPSGINASAPPTSTLKASPL